MAGGHPSCRELPHLQLMQQACSHYQGVFMLTIAQSLHRSLVLQGRALQLGNDSLVVNVQIQDLMQHTNFHCLMTEAHCRSERPPSLSLVPPRPAGRSQTLLLIAACLDKASASFAGAGSDAGQ